MATLQIENLPDELYDRIQNFAVQQNLSMNEVAIQWLSQAAPPPKDEKSTVEVLSEIRSRPRFNPLELGLSDSTDLIREDRNR